MTVVLLLACTDYDVGGKPDPVPPQFPEDPDGVCPAELEVSRTGARRTFSWDWEPEYPWYNDERYGGPGTFNGLDTWAEESRNSDGAVWLVSHYLCDQGNAWLAAKEAPGGEDICPCAERDCIFQTELFEPPILAWWAEGVELGLPWTTTTQGTKFYLSIVECERHLDVIDVQPELVATLTPSARTSIELPAGTFEATRLALDWTLCRDCWDFWYSTEALGLVRADGHFEDEPTVYELATLTLPE